MPPRLLTHDGRTQTLAAWAAERGLTATALRQRLSRLGMTVADALARPMQTQRRRKGGRYPAGTVRPCPPMREHKRGGAYCRWRSGSRVCERHFGPWASEEARRNYGRFMAEWATGSAQHPADPHGESVSALVARWLAHAATEYRKDGKLTGTYTVCQCACRALNELYGDTGANDFRPGDLRTVRQVWVDRGLARITCNQYADILVRMFGWAVGQSLVPPTVVHALREVESLKAGRTTAPDKPKKTSATDAQIAAVLPYLSPNKERRARLVAMVTLQRLTGMRPGEVAKLRPCDLDRTADVWRYTVSKPKGFHRGKPQVYYLGPRAVAILAPLLGAPAVPVFGISPQGYSVAIKDACVKAGCPKWTPHQLRHALATEVAERFRSMTHAAAAIGDTVGVAQAVYVHVDPLTVAKIEVAKEMG